MSLPFHLLSVSWHLVPQTPFAWQPGLVGACLGRTCSGGYFLCALNQNSLFQVHTLPLFFLACIGCLVPDPWHGTAPDCSYLILPQEACFGLGRLLGVMLHEAFDRDGAGAGKKNGREVNKSRDMQTPPESGGKSQGTWSHEQSQP